MPSHDDRHRPSAALSRLAARWRTERQWRLTSRLPSARADCVRVAERNANFIEAGLLATRAYETERERAPIPDDLPQRVEALLSRLLKTEQRSPKLLLARACIYERQRKYARAIDDLTEVINLNTGAGIPWLYRARMRRYAAVTADPAKESQIGYLEAALVDLAQARKSGVSEADVADQEQKVQQAIKDVGSRRAPPPPRDGMASERIPPPSL